MYCDIFLFLFINFAQENISFWNYKPKNTNTGRTSKPQISPPSLAALALFETDPKLPSLSLWFLTLTSPAPTNKAVKFSLARVDIATFELPVFDDAAFLSTVQMFAQFNFNIAKREAWRPPSTMDRYEPCFQDSLSIHSICPFFVAIGYDADWRQVNVSPSCNFGVPGGIKRAIDYLYNEIKGNPFLIISYGILRSGPASDALQMSLTKGISAHVIETRLTLSFAWTIRV